MKVYLDLIFILNFLFDFIILLSTSILLKRNIKIFKIIFGALFGSLTIISLFIRLNSIQLFLFKFLISIFMILIVFGFKDIRYFIRNLYYLYMVSIVLGGFLYFINNQIGYKNEGILFINNGVSLNILLAIILSPIILYIYIKQINILKNNYNKYYKVKLIMESKNIYEFNAFLDTGNKLIDPYKKRPIMLVRENIIKESDINRTILVPYYTVNSEGLLKCIIPFKVYINNIECKKKIVIGLTTDIKLDGIDCILNEKILEE